MVAVETPARRCVEEPLGQAVEAQVVAGGNVDTTTDEHAVRRPLGQVGLEEDPSLYGSKSDISNRYVSSGRLAHRRLSLPLDHVPHVMDLVSGAITA